MKKILLMFLLAAATAFAQPGFDPVAKRETLDRDGVVMQIAFGAGSYVTMQKGDKIIGSGHLGLKGTKGQMASEFKVKMPWTLNVFKL